MASALRSDGTECVLFELSDEAGAQDATTRELREFKPQAIAAGGPAATALALSYVPEVPVVAFMVPNAADAPFMDQRTAGRKRLICLASDVDPEQQLRWIAESDPDVKRLAVLCSPRTEQTAARLAGAGKRHGISVRAVHARKDEFIKAIETLAGEGYDGAIMIPDSEVYNSPNVQRLLLWGARNKKPIWTFSSNVVKAGAFAGLYCDAKSVGEQAARHVKERLAGETFASNSLQYPQHVDRAVNVHTAKIIGIDLNQEAYGPDVVRMGED